MDKRLDLKATLDTKQANNSLQKLVRSSAGVQTFAFGRGTSALTYAFASGSGFATGVGVIGIIKKAAEAFVDAAQTAEKGFMEFAKNARSAAEDFQRTRLLKSGERAGLGEVGKYSENAAKAQKRYEMYGQQIEAGWKELRKTFTSSEIEYIQKNGIQKSLSQMLVSGDKNGNFLDKAKYWYRGYADPIGRSIDEKLSKDTTGLVGRLAALSKITDKYKSSKQDVNAYERIMDRMARMSITTIERGVELNDMSKRGLYTSDFMKQAATQTPELKKMDEQTDILRSIRDQLMSGNYKDVGGLE